jgi:hypothetical protein
MRKLYTFLLFALSTIILSTEILAQDPPDVVWEGYYPTSYSMGNYTANDVKQTLDGGYMMVGSRNMTWNTYGYNQVMFMKLNDNGVMVMNEIFEGFENTNPGDQELFEVIITPEPNTYLATGFRDSTLTSDGTPPGLMLIEFDGDGNVLFDSLYYNDNLHRVIGRCIRPAIEGGYIIIGSFAQDGGGTEQTFITRMVKDESDAYVFADSPIIKLIDAGSSGYATWIQQFQDGYLMGGTAYRDQSTKFDMFLQKIDADTLTWTRYYGGTDSDEFADAFVYGDTIYVAGSAGVLVPGTSFYNDQIYVAKLDAEGNAIWENTYGGTYRHFAHKIMMTGEGDLLVAGSYWDATMHNQMILMKIDAETGESIWTQEYGDFYNAGFRDAIRTDDFGYLTIGRASTGSNQNPQVYTMKLDHGGETEHLQIPRENLGIPITPGSTTTDVINFTTFTDTMERIVDTIVATKVIIYSLLHPDMSELEVALLHDGKVAVLADRPENGGANFDTTGFFDFAYRHLRWGQAPYKGWWKPVDTLAVFSTSDPAGEWTLRIVDFGTGGTKKNRVLDGWSLNFLVGTSGGSETGIPTQEEFANFGLQTIRPNPLSQQGLITFRLPKPGHARLMVFNQLGQVVGMVADEDFAEGVHERIWNPGTLAPGTYFLQLESGGMISVRKALVTR